MKLKRYISFLLSFVMLFSCCQLTSFAGAGLVGTEKAKLEFSYLVEDADSADGSGFTAAEPGTLAVGDTFFVGVKTVDFANIREVADAILGITDISFGLAYDPTYLKLEPNNRTNAGALTGAKLKTALKNRLDYDGSFLAEDDDGYAYELDASLKTSYDAGINTDKEVAYVLLTNPCIEDAMLPSYKGEEERYVAIFEFEVLAVPTGGATVFALSEGEEDTVLKFGFTGETADGDSVEEGLYQQEYSAVSDTNINTVIDFDFSKVNIFPTLYTVKFYNDYDSDTSTLGAELTGKDIIVKEGSSVSATDGAVVPEASDFTAPTGKYYSKLQYLDKDGNAQDFDPTMTLNSSVFADGDTTLEVFATYQNGHNVTFNSNYPTDSGKTDTTEVVTVAPTAGATIAAADEPTVGTSGTENFDIPTGYVFKEWNTASDGSGTKIEFGDGGTDVSSIDDVYAIWTQAIKVEFVKVKGDTAQDNVVETYYIDPDAADKTVAAPATNPTRDGYVFDKWCYDVAGTATDFVAKGNTGATEFSANTTVYATWKKSVKVIYYDTDKTTQLKDETIVTGDSFTPPTVNDDTTNNKYFNGWKNKADDSVVDTSQALSADVTVDTLELYADMKDAYTVKFYKEAEKTNLLDTKYSNSVTPAALGDANMPADPTETGKKFSGWKVVGTGATFDETTVVNGDMEVYAAWDSLWKIDFYEDSTDTSAETKYVDPSVKTLGSDMPADPADRTGYRFDGWYIENTTNKVDATTEFSGDTKVVGKWTQLFEVEFYPTLADAQAGTNKLSSDTVDSGNKVTASKIPTTADNDTDKKYFIGWKKVDGTAFNPATDAVTSDLKLYEDWGDYYKVEFYTEDTLASDKLYDTKYVNPNTGNTVSALPSPNPTKTGYGFNEWRVYDSTAGAVTTTKFDTSTTVSGNMTVVADWIQKVKISFYPNDGTGAGGLGTVVEEYVTPNVAFDGTVPTVSRTGYTLKEWNTASNGSGTGYTNVATETFTTDTTLYAIWTANGPDTATLTFDANLDGVTPNPPSVTVNINDKVYSSNIPVVAKTDYRFDGWYASPSISDTTAIDFSAGYTVTEDKTVYAHWTYIGADAVTVTFMNDSTQYAAVTVAPNTTLGTMMPTNPTKSGFAFKEWNTATDGTGTKFEGTTNVGTTAVTVYSQWIEDITVNYNANGGDNGPASVTKPAGNAYEDPDVTNMTKGNYTFVGWNTEQNGSGTYVAAEDGLTYADVAEIFTPDGGTAPTSVTVYAQWAWTPDDEDTIDDIQDDTPVDPAVGGVRVTFDSNSAGATTTVKDANPKYKYPQLGDAIGTDNMPNEPTREKYVFKGWNTAQDGSGVAFSGTTTVDSTTLGTALVEIMENDAGTGKYEVTLYAQWELAPDVLPAEAVTITFNKNLDGSGAAGDVIKTVTLYKGDPLGYDIAAPKNGKYEFNGWYAGSVVDGKVSFTTNKFTATTPINDSVDYYAQWQMYLLVQVQPKVVDGAEVDYTYTGQEIKPQYKVFQITYPNGNQQPYEIVDETTPIYAGDLTDSQFKVEYKKDGSVATLKDAGIYTINASFADGSALQAAGAQIAVTDAPTIEIKPAGLTFKINPESQSQKAGKVTLPTPVSVEGIQNNEVADTIYGNAYYAWTDTDNDNNIADAELAITTTAEDVGDYVWKIELKSSNYVIEKVESSVDGKDVLKYGVTADYPTYTGSKEGQNLVLEVVPNDPSISGVVVESVDNKDADGNAIDPANKETLGLKKNDYTSDETFDSAEEPTVTDYYIRVTDKDAEEVTFTLTLTNPETTTLTATGGTAVKNADGTYTVTAPLTNKGATANVVTITTKAGNDADAPTLTYTFNIQQLVEAKIVLNYGNSPYGEIMKDSAITDKDAAKAAFNSANKFATGFIPTGANTKLYSPKAWGNSTDSSVNLDRNDYAIFIYNKKSFKDPGFTATDALGNSVTDTDITRKITINRMSANSTTGMKDANVTSEDITITNVANNAVIDQITSSSQTKGIRPGSYSMEYSFTDPVTNETVTVTRPVVVVWAIGDADLSTIRNAADSSAITAYVKGTSDPTNGVDTASVNFFLYRIMDVDHSGIVNAADSSGNTSVVKGVSEPVSFYNELN